MRSTHAPGATPPAVLVSPAPCVVAVSGGVDSLLGDVVTSEMDAPASSYDPVARCFYCQSHLYAALVRVAGTPHAPGANTDHATFGPWTAVAVTGRARVCGPRLPPDAPSGAMSVRGRDFPMSKAPGAPQSIKAQAVDHVHQPDNPPVADGESSCA